MPAHTKYGRPDVQLVRVLTDLRAQGVPFDQAWAKAVGTFQTQRGLVKYPHATVERRFWRACFQSQREEWRKAYNREPSKTADAVLHLTALLADDRSDIAHKAPDGAAWEVEPKMAITPIAPPGAWHSNDPYLNDPPSSRAAA
ncbi:MAG: hypothetical protein J2O48_02545 [Solirubrobacterales bacterium]|nr:hypothetical protein [Solirubrobacterales bacterium]